MDSFTIGNSMSKLSLLETWHPRTDADLDAITSERISPGERLLECYTVESEPLKGGMGSVWRVRYDALDKPLAMKRPQPRFFAEAGVETKARFIHECEAWIGLGLHPNIVACYYVRDIGGVPSIFAEWMEGGSLERRIRDGSLYDGTPEENQARLLRIALQFARGLRYAHDRGMVHQDVKPDNVLLTANMVARVSDFGLSGAYETLAAGGAIAGSGAYTVAYCSPEQARREPLSIRTDIYSWAVSVMEMYAGGCRWRDGREAGERCEAYLADCRVDVPEGLAALLRRCMREREADRPADFGEVEDALRAVYREACGADWDGDDGAAASDSADSLNNQAVSYMEIGLSDSAAHCWEEAGEIDPTHVEALYNRALIAWRSGEQTDMEVWRKLLSHPFFMRTEAGREAVEALAREAGKRAMDEPLFADEPERECDSGVGLWRGRAYVPESAGDALFLKVMDAGTGALIERIDLSEVARRVQDRIGRVFLSEDCAQLGLAVGKDRVIVCDIASKAVLYDVRLGETSMYDSGINYMLLGRDSRFLKRMVSHGMGHAAPTPETYDLSTGRRVRQGQVTYADWQLVNAGADALPDEAKGKEYPCTLCDGLRAVPVLEQGETLMACDDSGRPTAALPRALAKEAPDIRRDMPGEGVRRIVEDGTVWLAGSEGLMQFDLSSGKCLRSYGLPERFFMQLYVDERGEGVIWRRNRGRDEKPVWKYRPLPPVREEDRAGWLIAALESFEEYRDRVRRLESLYGDFRRADDGGDRAGMCRIYGEASGIRRFFGSENQQAMARRLNAACRQRNGYLLQLENGELTPDAAAGILAPFGLNGAEDKQARPQAARETPRTVTWPGGAYAFADEAEKRAFTGRFVDAFRVLDADEAHGLIAVVAKRSKGGIEYNFKVWSVDERRFLLDIPLTGYWQDKWIAAGFGRTEAAKQHMLLAVTGVEPRISLENPPYAVYQFSCDYGPEAPRRVPPKASGAERATGGKARDDAVAGLHRAYRDRAVTAVACPGERACQRERDNAAVKLKAAFQDMGKALDVEALSRWHGEYRALAEARPAAEGCGPMRDFVQSQLAFALSQREAPAEKLRALALYDDLAARYPEKELYRKNAGVLANQLVAALERLGAAQDAEGLEPLYEAARSQFGGGPAGEEASRVRTSAESQYAFALSRKEDLESKLKALALYDALAERHPEKALYAKNAQVVANQALVSFDRMGEALDAEALEGWHGRCAELQSERPGRELIARVFDGAEAQLAFALSRTEDIDSKERALEMFEGLSRRRPEEPAYVRNAGILEGQLFRLRREQKKQERRKAREEGRGGLFSLFKRK